MELLLLSFQAQTDKGQNSEKQRHAQNAILLSLNGVFTNF
jgi:hypothetical protein